MDIKQFSKDPKKFLNRITMVFGEPNSESAATIYEIMKLLEKQVSTVFVICAPNVPIESSKYYGKIPYIEIRNDVDIKWLEAFLERQIKIREIYRTGNIVDINPNAMLIYEDCASIIKKWNKESPIIKELFYNNRFNYITHIISAKHDKEIDVELRNNAEVNIFTTSEEASSNFGRAANRFSKADVERAEICIKRIFSKTNTKENENRKKLVYSRMDKDPFTYMI